MTASPALDQPKKGQTFAVALTIVNVALLGFSAYAVLVVLPVAWRLTGWASALVIAGGPLAVIGLVMSLRLPSVKRMLLLIPNILVLAAYLFFWGLFFLGRR